MSWNQQESYVSVCSVWREKNEKSCQVIADHFWWHKMYFFAVSVFRFFRLAMRNDSYKYLDLCPFETIAPFFTHSLYFSIPLPMNVAHTGNVTLAHSLGVKYPIPILVCVFVHRSIIAQLIEWLGIFFVTCITVSGCCSIRNAKVHFPLLHAPFLHLLCGRICFPSLLHYLNATFGFNGKQWHQQKICFVKKNPE